VSYDNLIMFLYILFWKIKTYFLFCELNSYLKSVFEQGWDLKNDWDYSFTSLVSQPVSIYVPLQTSSFLSYVCFTPMFSRGPKSNGTCRRHFDTQVKFSIRHSVCSVLYIDVPSSLNLCYLYYFCGSFLLGQIREFDHV